MSERTTPVSVEVPGKAAPRPFTAVQWFLGVSVAAYFLQRTVITAADLQEAFGVDTQAVSRHWWSIVTYPFVHAGVWTLALNLYTLWFFAPRLEARWGTREFLRFAFVCAVGGWIAHLSLVPAGTVMIGATSVVLGVLVAYATLWPTEKLLVFGARTVSTRWFLVVFALLNVMDGAIFDEGGSAYLAHLGGLVAGWLYLRAVLSEDRERLRRRVTSVPEVAENELSRAVPRSMPPEPPGRAARPEPILDSILDKISVSGIGSLSSDERATLDAASRRLREP